MTFRIAIVQPIIVDGRLLAFSAAMTHHQDMGGMSAGSVPTNATEIYQEGLRLPPLKLRPAPPLNTRLPPPLNPRLAPPPPPKLRPPPPPKL